MFLNSVRGTRNYNNIDCWIPWIPTTSDGSAFRRVREDEPYFFHPEKIQTTKELRTNAYKKNSKLSIAPAYDLQYYCLTRVYFGARAQQLNFSRVLSFRGHTELYTIILLCLRRFIFSQVSFRGRGRGRADTVFNIIMIACGASWAYLGAQTAARRSPIRVIYFFACGMEIVFFFIATDCRSVLRSRVYIIITLL